jgi:hypothetical protein
MENLELQNDQRLSLALLSLLRDLEVIKSQQKLLDEQEAVYRAKILALMQDNGIEKESTDYGSVRLQSKQKKIYPKHIKELENQFKEAKKLADDMGDYDKIIEGNILVYTAPSAPF